MRRSCSAFVIILVLGFLCSFMYYYNYKTDNRPQSTHLLAAHSILSPAPKVASLTPPPKLPTTYNRLQTSVGLIIKSLTPTPPTKVASVGRRPDDGVWFNFSAPPALQFFAYSAFVDVRASPAVIRVIAMSTKIEDQRQRGVTLFCVCDYKDGRPHTVSALSADPGAIGMGYPFYGLYVREYVYACPLMYHDSWPVSLSISTKPQQHNSSSSMPVEVPTTQGVKKPLAVCTQISYKYLNPVRLVEWLEFQRLLGVSLVGVYLGSDLNQPAQKVFRYYAEVEGLVDLRRTDYISRVVGGSLTSPGQHFLHLSPMFNDCIYRNMFRYNHIGVMDFDEVFCSTLIAKLH